MEDGSHGKESTMVDRTARAEIPGDLDHPNLEVVVRAGELIASGFSEPDEGLFADDFVFHYFNKQLPDLNGDYHGLDGMRTFFERLQTDSDGSFRIEPLSLTPFGDELVAAYVTNKLTLGSASLEIDALVVWRVVGRQILEAWDIPAVNTPRTGDEH